ncbi:MAG: urea ABC transporter permease subunit UrtB [Planctomycetota bacterium]|nr:MAG: urea ABC transporter permease subunit UrtB [Planctomycetota bacterium]
MHGFARLSVHGLVRSVRSGIVCALLCSMALLGAQEEDEANPLESAAADAAAVAAGDADEESLSGEEIEERLEALLLQLLDREQGPAAVAAMVSLADERVEWALQRVMDRSISLWQGRAVHVVTGEGGKSQLYTAYAAIDEDERIVDEPLATVDRSELDNFRVHRAVRRASQEALAMVGLLLPNADNRRRAADRLGNRGVVEALPLLAQLREDDPNSRVRRAAAVAISLIHLTAAADAASEEERVTAAQTLGRYKSLRGLTVLERRQRSVDEGTLQVSADEQEAMTAAISRIRWHQWRTDWIGHAFAGVSLGSILVLIALGLAITFGVMGVINMAHGEMLMLGAVTSWACFEFLSPHVGDWYYAIAFPMAFLVAAGVGMVMEFSLLRYLYKRPLDSLLATIGVSLVLIQAVRQWRGDNLGMSTPALFSGGWEIMQDVTLPWNRLFLIALAIFCVISVLLILRGTRFGLLLRATVQNREIAAAMGVNTRRMDLLTFALGCGLAGLAGYGMVLLTNPSPGMGTTYIVKSFLVTVVGGVGNFFGVVLSGMGLGMVEKLVEPITIMEKPFRFFDSTWSQVFVLFLVIIIMQRRPSGLFPDRGRQADQADRTAMPWMRPASRSGDVIAGSLLIFLGLIVVPFCYGMGWMNVEYVNKLGYIASFAICAVGLDLIWGYMGTLSLCQFLFFALGGYAMGIYLINHGPQIGGIPQSLAYNMSSGGEVPVFISWFANFPAAVFLGLLIPGLLALLIGFTTFRSKMRGVYFAILTQAITVAFWLVFQKNDIGLGGTNGLTGFSTILGFPIATQADAGPFAQTRFWLYIATTVILILAAVGSKWLVRSGWGRVLVAIRDDETRLRFNGYRTWMVKSTTFALAAMLAAIGGMLYVPQKGIITPAEMAPMASIMVVVWVALGGRASVWGAILGAVLVNLLYEMLTIRAPQYWPFLLGGLFILVPRFLPGGLTSIPIVAWLALLLRRRQPASAAEDQS